MPIKSNDKLSSIINFENRSTRIDSFIWISVAQNNPYFINMQWEHNSSRDIIATHLEKYQGFARDIGNRLRYNFIPDNHLDWMEDNSRHPLWIQHFIKSPFFQNQVALNKKTIHPLQELQSPLNTNFSIPHHLEKRNRGVAIFDYLEFLNSIETKEQIEHSRLIQSAWEDSTKLDRHFIWLNEDESEKKRDFFWHWLERNKPQTIYGRTKFCDHEGVLILFDGPQFSDSAREYFNKDARKLWNQQKRREDSTDRKQCNFVLPQKTISKLKNLSDEHGLNRTEIIELLIESEFKNKTYISQRLAKKSLLTSPLE